MLAAGGFVGLLDGIAEVARGAGLDELGALAIYAPAHPPEPGQRGAPGHRERPDRAVRARRRGHVRAHLAALERLAPGALELYLAVARRELAIAVAAGT